MTTIINGTAFAPSHTKAEKHLDIIMKEHMIFTISTSSRREHEAVVVNMGDMAQPSLQGCRCKASASSKAVAASIRNNETMVCCFKT